CGRGRPAGAGAGRGRGGGGTSRCPRCRRASGTGPASGCRVVLPRPWAAPITNVVNVVGWMDPLLGVGWQVGVPDGGSPPPRPATDRGLRGGGDDRGEVGGREAQVPAQECAWHLPGGGLLPQPRLADLEQLRGLRRRVQHRRARARRLRGGVLVRPSTGPTRTRWLVGMERHDRPSLSTETNGRARA